MLQCAHTIQKSPSWGFRGRVWWVWWVWVGLVLLCCWLGLHSENMGVEVWELVSVNFGIPWGSLKFCLALSSERTLSRIWTKTVNSSHMTQYLSSWPLSTSTIPMTDINQWLNNFNSLIPTPFFVLHGQQICRGSVQCLPLPLSIYVVVHFWRKSCNHTYPFACMGML